MVGEVRQALKCRFGSFEFDPRRHELRRNGHRVKLAASQLRLLTLFLERNGELITREEIAARLWTDTRNIDVSTGINTAINRLRRHLQESPKAPSAIETVIGLGYRFVPELSVDLTAVEAEAIGPAPRLPEPTAEIGPAPPLRAEPPDVSGPEHEPTAEATPPTIPLGDEAVPEAASAPEIGAAALEPVPAPPSTGDTAAPTIHGDVRQPSLPQQNPGAGGRISQRAGWIAGFAACILLLLTGTASLRSHWRSSRPGPTADLEGTSGRELVSITSERPLGEVTASAVSPDGAVIAYADRFGVSVHWVDSKVERLLGVRPAFVVDRLAWLPDQTGLLMSGTDTEAHVQQVWAVPLQGAYLQPILQNADRAVLSPDGKRIAFTRNQDQEIWEASSDGQGLSRVLQADPGNAFGLLLWSPAGDHLVLTESAAPAGAHTPAEMSHAATYLSVDAVSGKVLDREGGIPTQSGYFLPDGQLFFVQNNTPGPTTGEAILMTVQTDRQTGRLISSPRFVQKLLARHAESLTASLTGTRFAAVLDKAEADTFVADLHWPGPSFGDAVQLTKGSHQNYPHSWTADSSGVLLENDSLKPTGSSGKYAIFQVALNGAAPKLVAQLPNDAAMAQLSPDGRWILFLQFEGRPQRASGIFRVPVEGGPAERVPTHGNLEEFHCSASRAGRCVVREVVDQDKLVYYALDPVSGMGEELARTRWEPNRLGDWGLSADGAFVAAAQHDTLHPAVELVSLASHGTSIRTLPVPGHGTTLGASWSPDGKTLFVECRTESGFELVSLDLAGHIRSLRTSPSLIWAVVSRDSRKVAFPGLALTSSVWASNLQPGS